MSQKDLLNINENSNSVHEEVDQHNPNINNDLIERQKKFERITGTNNVNIDEYNEVYSKKKNETANNNELKNNDMSNNLIDIREKNGSGLFISKY